LEDLQLEANLQNLIAELSDDLYTLELLIFFSRHPHARFNNAAVLRAVHNRPYDTNVALKKLITRKIIVTQFENGINLYSLTTEEPVHSMCSKLVNIDQQQWRMILENILDIQGFK